MASTISSARSGSRAIQIPHSESQTEAYPPAIQSRRRGGRYIKASGLAEGSDAGPSSLSSDQSSSWSGSPSYDEGQSMGSSGLSNGYSPKGTRLPIQRIPPGSSIGISSSKKKDKAPLRPSTPPQPPTAVASGPVLSNSPSSLGPSMRLSTSYKSVNLNEHRPYDPDEPPRLITYTKYGQGFTWNDEVFLPSYLVGRYSGRGRRKHYDGDFGDEESCPVAEIFVTEEEAESMMP